MDVVFVQGDTVGVGGIVATGDLPKARYTGSNCAIKAEFGAIFGHFRTYYEPWTDQTHLPDQDIPELRQLVETGAS